MQAKSLLIRPATGKDVPLIRQFILVLAAFEKLSHEVKATDARLQATLFGSPPDGGMCAGLCQGRAAGFALFFGNYSTFLSKPGL